MATRSTPGDPELQRLLQAAFAAQQAGRVDAPRLFEAVLARDPRNPLALNALGLLALARQAAAEAERLFAAAADADPQAGALALNLAKARRLLGDAPGERAALTRALEIDQRDLNALVRMAELEEREGEEGAAARRWTAVLQLASALPNRPPELDRLLDHARGVVAAHTARLEAAVSEAMADATDGLSARDRRRFQAFRDAAYGRRRIYVNQCEGLTYPFLPADEWFDRELFPWFEQLEARTDAIRGELDALFAAERERFLPYVQMEKGTPANPWTPLDRSLDWSALHLWRHGRRLDENADRCPITSAALAELPLADMPSRSPTVFFSLLRPRSHIPAHTGVTNARAIVHLPLIVPEGCRFRVGGETRPWRVGEAFAFDDTIDHEAWNDSDALRAVLIFDVWNPHLSQDERDLVRRFFDAADRSGFAPPVHD